MTHADAVRAARALLGFVVCWMILGMLADPDVFVTIAARVYRQCPTVRGALSMWFMGECPQ
jgi:hypothetical protein